MTLFLLTAAALLTAIGMLVLLSTALRPPARFPWRWAALLIGVVLLAGLALLTADAGGARAAEITRTLSLCLAGPALLVAALDVHRRTPLRLSRGALGLTAAALLLFLSFAVPYVQAYVSLNDPLPEATAEATVEATDEMVEMEGFLTVERVQIEALFQAVRQVLADEVGLDEVTVFSLLDAGVPLAQIVENEGGELTRVESQLVQLLRTAVRASALRGEIPTWQAALFISQMELFVRLAVRTDLNTFRGFGGPTPTGTQPSLLILLTEAPAQIAPRTATPPPAPSLAADPTPTASE